MHCNRRDFLAAISFPLVGAVAACQSPLRGERDWAVEDLVQTLDGPATLSPMAETPRDPFDVALGRRLRAAREALGMHQDDVAAFIRKSQATVSDYELGKAKPSPRDLDRFCTLYRMSGDQLLGREPMPDWKDQVP